MATVTAAADLADSPDDNIVISPNNKRLAMAVDNNSIRDVMKAVGRSRRMANVNFQDKGGWPVLHKVSTDSSTHLNSAPSAPPPTNDHPKMQPLRLGRDPVVSRYGAGPFGAGC